MTPARSLQRPSPCRSPPDCRTSLPRQCRRLADPLEACPRSALGPESPQRAAGRLDHGIMDRAIHDAPPTERFQWHAQKERHKPKAIQGHTGMTPVFLMAVRLLSLVIGRQRLTTPRRWEFPARCRWVHRLGVVHRYPPSRSPNPIRISGFKSSLFAADARQAFLPVTSGQPHAEQAHCPPPRACAAEG
jgi:hypothetical protein